MNTTAYSLVVLLSFGAWLVLDARRRGRRTVTGYRRRRAEPASLIRPLRYLPVGTAAMVTIGGDPPVVVTIGLGVLLAAIHRLLPHPFHLAAGCSATAVVVAEAMVGTDCREPVGLATLGLILAGAAGAAFASCVPAVSGTGSLRRATIPVAASAGALAAVTTLVPVGGVAIGTAVRPGLAVTVVAIVALAAATGRSDDAVLAALGVAVLAALMVLRAEAGPCGSEATDVVVGALVFALTSAAMSHPRTRRRRISVLRTTMSPSWSGASPTRWTRASVPERQRSTRPASRVEPTG